MLNALQRLTTLLLVAGRDSALARSSQVGAADRSELRDWLYLALWTMRQTNRSPPLVEELLDDRAFAKLGPSRSSPPTSTSMLLPSPLLLLLAAISSTAHASPFQRPLLDDANRDRRTTAAELEDPGWRDPRPGGGSMLDVGTLRASAARHGALRADQHEAAARDGLERPRRTVEHYHFSSEQP